MGPPELLLLPAKAAKRCEVLNPTNKIVQTALADSGAAYGQHLILPRNIPEATTSPILLIAPIPTYLVYDGFEQDLDAAMVYERLLTTTQEGPMIDHAKAFLRSALVGPFRQATKNPSSLQLNG